MTSSNRLILEFADAEDEATYSANTPTSALWHPFPRTSVSLRDKSTARPPSERGTHRVLSRQFSATPTHGPGRRARGGRLARAGAEGRPWAWALKDWGPLKGPGARGVAENRGPSRGSAHSGALRAAAVTWPVCVTFSPVGEVRTPKHLAPWGKLSAVVPLRPSSRQKVTAAAILRHDP